MPLYRYLSTYFSNSNAAGYKRLLSSICIIQNKHWRAVNLFHCLRQNRRARPEVNASHLSTCLIENDVSLEIAAGTSQGFEITTKERKWLPTSTR